MNLDSVTGIHARGSQAQPKGDKISQGCLVGLSTFAFAAVVAFQSVLDLYSCQGAQPWHLHGDTWHCMPGGSALASVSRIRNLVDCGVVVVGHPSQDERWRSTVRVLPR